jgi:ABC-2 type transport system ATP-binding protein
MLSVFAWAIMGDTGHVIEVDGLIKEFKGFRALGPVSFTVKAGATGLLGPNGAGKTTLIKALLGLVDPTSGGAKVFGKDIVHNRLDVRQRVGYMPERDAYIPNMTGVQYVSYAGQLAGLPRAAAMQRSHEVLNFVAMGEERYRLVDTYSAGMRQKVKLAQALVHDPELLFLDEPTNGLDPRGRDEMLNLIRDISQRHGISVILSSHLLPDVEFVCPDVIVLNRGQTVAQGSLSELQQAQGDAWMVRIKGRPEAFVQALKKAKMRVFDQEGLWRVEGKGDGANRILAAADAAGVQVRQVTPKRSSLEDLFMDLVEREA